MRLNLFEAMLKLIASYDVYVARLASTRNANKPQFPDNPDRETVVAYDNAVSAFYQQIRDTDQARVDLMVALKRVVEIARDGMTK